MSAIVIQPNTRDSRVVAAPEDFMPISVRIKLAATINSAWADFVSENASIGPNLPEAFWEYMASR